MRRSHCSNHTPCAGGRTETRKHFSNQAPVALERGVGTPADATSPTARRRSTRTTRPATCLPCPRGWWARARHRYKVHVRRPHDGTSPLGDVAPSATTRSAASWPGMRLRATESRAPSRRPPPPFESTAAALSVARPTRTASWPVSRSRETAQHGTTTLTATSARAPTARATR